MALEFKFPDVGEGIHEGILVRWLVKEGDPVKADQNIAEVETDKAVVEIPSPKNGVILKVFHKEGQTITVGEVLAVIGEAGEKYHEKKEEKAHYTGSVVGFVPDHEEDLDAQRKNRQSNGKEPEHKIHAAPKARLLAKELKIDLSKVKGSGPNGVITEVDVHHAAQISKELKVEVHGPIERVPMKSIRKATAIHMSLAWKNAPMVTNHDDIDVTELAKVRSKEKDRAKGQGVSLTFVPYIIQALVSCLKKHPYIASSVEGEEIILKKYFHVGVAMDTPEGLLVPVIKDVDRKTLFDIAKEIMHFAQKAKSRKIELGDMKGGVITITNIGAIGGTYFTPIVNYPESAILGCGKIEDKAVVREGQIVIRKIMPISFSYDHRSIDGAEAARFMNDMKEILEKAQF